MQFSLGWASIWYTNDLGFDRLEWRLKGHAKLDAPFWEITFPDEVTFPAEFGAWQLLGLNQVGSCSSSYLAFDDA